MKLLEYNEHLYVQIVDMIDEELHDFLLTKHNVPLPYIMQLNDMLKQEYTTVDLYVRLLNYVDNAETISHEQQRSLVTELRNEIKDKIESAIQKVNK